MKLFKLVLVCLLLCGSAYGAVCTKTFSGGLADLYPFVFLLIKPYKDIVVRSGGHTTEYQFGQSGALLSVFVDGVEVANEENDPLFFLDATGAATAIDSACGAGFAESRAVPGPNLRASATGPIRPVGQTNKDVALADFNGDGIPDSAIIGGTSIFVTLLRADGTTLSSSTSRVSGISVALNLASGDFNGDGIVDLATTQGTFSTSQNPYPAGNIVLLLGNGDGTFQAPVTFPVGSVGNSFLASGDFNGDGISDLAMTHRSSSTAGSVAVMFGKKDGTLGAVVDYPVGPNPFALMTGDFNGDSKTDLLAMDAFGAANKVWVLSGKGDGTFQTAVSSPSGTNEGFPSYTDLNQDGIADLVIADFSASAMEVMMGRGDGTFQTGKKYLLSSQPTSVALLPLGDGNTWLTTADNAGTSLFTFFITKDGVVHSPELETIGAAASGIAAGDLNKDGVADIVITDTDAGKLYVKLSTGKGAFAAPVPYPVVGAGAVAIADVNGDGNGDVLIADRTGLDVLLGQGGGTLGSVTTFPANGTPSSLSVADFNGDGKPDLAEAVGDGVAVFLGNGNGTFQSVRKTSSTNVLAAANGDFNGDGKPDLIVTNGAIDFQTAGAVSVLLGNGDGTFRSGGSLSLSAPLLSNALAVGDLNGDGKLDAVTVLFAGSRGTLAVLLGKGDGTFQAPIAVPSNTAAPVIAITDLNGDKKADLVLGDCCGLSEASFLLGNGDGTFQEEVQFPSGPEPVGIAVADFDGNGKPDLALLGQIEIPSPRKSTLAILYNAFSAPASTVVVSSANPAAVGIAPGALATVYGSNLAQGTPGVTPTSLPTTFGGTSVAIVDASGKSWQAPLLYVSSVQVNFLLPTGVASGTAHLTVTSGDGTTTALNVQVVPIAPGLFVLNSANLVAANATKYSSDGSQQPQQVYAVNGVGAVVANAIDLGSATDQVYLSLYGTGLQAAGTAGVKATIGGTALSVQYAGVQGFFPGLDQVNVILPHSLAGSGDVALQLTAGGLVANTVRLTIR